MILRAILMIILAISSVRCQQGLTPGGTHDALSVGRQGSSPSSSSRSTLVNDIRGALSSALDTGRLGSLGGSSSSTQNGVQQEPLPGFGSTDQLRSSPGGFPQTVVEAQPGQGSFSGGTTDQFGGFDTSSQDFGFGGRSENIPPRTQDSTGGGGSFLTSAGRSGTGIGTLPSGSDISTGSSGFTFGSSGTTGTLSGPGTGTQTGQGQSFGFGAPPTGFGSQTGPGFTFGSSGTTGTLPSSGTGGQTTQGQSFGFGAPPTGFGSQMGPALSFSPPMDSGPQTPTGGFGIPPTSGAGMGAMAGMTGTFGSRSSAAGVTGGSMGVAGGNMTPPGTGMFMPQGPGSFMMQPPGPGMGAFASRMSLAGPIFGPGSVGGGTIGAEPSPGSGGMQGLPRGISLPGISPPSGMTFPMPGMTFPSVSGSSGSTTAGGGASSRFFSPFPGMGPTGGFDQSLATPGTSGFFMTPGFPPGMFGGQAGTGMFGIPTSTGSGTTEWQTSGAMSSGLPTSSIPTGAFFPGMTSPGSFSLPTTGTSGAGSSFQTTQGGTGMLPPGSGTSSGGGVDASSGTFPGMTFVSGTGGPFLPPGFFVPGGGQVSGGGGSSGRDGFFPDSTRTGSGVIGLVGNPFGDFSSSQGFDPRIMPSGGPGQFMTFGAGPIFTRRGRMPMDFFIRRR
ncbi:hypothetical protein CHS0354_031345 [Potamilus streckersoni]|uniref:Uncharacterized protein n=1 Tax=Potamilus streckersoni TaxID=2493646 RepID=A0AAE0SJR3_9BIVA|nr:hypothetical protein CHS0354_031345 [Potamilus streckersoni]